jgi:hypothetical protein
MVFPLLSVTLTVNLNALVTPTTVGVPLITPVEALSVRPLGSEPAAIAHV